MNKQRIYELRKVALKQKQTHGYVDHFLLLELIDLTFEEYVDKDVGFWDYLAQFKTVINMFCVYHRN